MNARAKAVSGRSKFEAGSKHPETFLITMDEGASSPELHAADPKETTSFTKEQTPAQATKTMVAMNKIEQKMVVNSIMVEMMMKKKKKISSVNMVEIRLL